MQDAAYEIAGLQEQLEAAHAETAADIRQRNAAREVERDLHDQLNHAQNTIGELQQEVHQLNNALHPIIGAENEEGEEEEEEELEPMENDGWEEI